MTPTDAEIRANFAKIRRLVQLTGPPGAQVCQAEEDMVSLAQRQRRAPSALVTAAGYPSGGNSEGRSSDRTSITERAAVRNVEDERIRQEEREKAIAEGRIPKEDPSPDPVGKAFVLAVHNLDMTAHTSSLVLGKITAAKQQSSIRKPRAHQADICVEDACTKPAVPGGRGRCEADRKWLERHPDVQSVPAAVIERRDNPRKRHDHDPDDLIDRLVTDYDEAS